MSTNTTTLVLLPGLDGTGTLFVSLMPHLPPHIHTKIIAYPPNQPLNYSELLPLIQAQLPTTPFHVLGESFSGPLATALAALNPPNLLSTILVCTFAKAPYPRPLLHAFIPLCSPNLGPLLIAPLMGTYTSTSTLKAISTALSTLTTPTLHARLRSVANCDTTTLLPAITTPILYLQASQDLLVPNSALTTIQQHFPNLQTAHIPGPHFLLQTNPKACAQHIASFISQHSLTPTSLQLSR